MPWLVGNCQELVDVAGFSWGSCGHNMVGHLSSNGGKWSGKSQYAWVIVKQLVARLLAWRFSVLGRDLVDECLRAGQGQRLLTVYYFPMLSVG